MIFPSKTCSKDKEMGQTSVMHVQSCCLLIKPIAFLMLKCFCHHHCYHSISLLFCMLNTTMAEPYIKSQFFTSFIQ